MKMKLRLLKVMTIKRADKSHNKKILRILQEIEIVVLKVPDPSKNNHLRMDPYQMMKDQMEGI